MVEAQTCLPRKFQDNQIFVEERNPASKTQTNQTNKQTRIIYDVMQEKLHNYFRYGLRSYWTLWRTFQKVIICVMEDSKVGLHMGIWISPIHLFNFQWNQLLFIPICSLHYCEMIKLYPIFILKVFYFHFYLITYILSLFWHYI